MDVGWFVRRLGAMSPAEVVQRSRQQLRRTRWRRNPAAGAPTPHAVRSFTSPAPDPTSLTVDPGTVHRLLGHADAIVDGSLDVLGIRRDDLAAPDWFLDPSTGRHAPDDVHAFAIVTRDATQVGAVKHVWELSRHQHLTVLAAAYWTTGDERYARRVDEQLRSWWAANPFLAGVHWTSGIELGLRLISWTWIRRLLAAWPPVIELFDANPVFVGQLGDHQRYLAAFPSVGSSANNHAIAEAAGQLVAAVAFPWFATSAGWRDDGSRRLLRELATQTFPSGLNREQATDYHGFVLELALVAAAELAIAGRGVPIGLADPIVRMTDALATIVDDRLRPPRQGDSDGGGALVVDPPGPDRWGSLLATGAGLFGSRAWWPQIPPPDMRGGLLVAALGGSFPAAAERPAGRAALLADAGTVVVRAAHHGAHLWCRGDVGPHGHTSIAAHAHADALSLELRVDGVDVLADPGTYCYHGAPAWRSYFRSTAGHSTLQVDGRDQSTSGGPFLWTRHARTRLLASSGLEGGPVARWVAEHDGYSRRRAPLVHRRAVELDRTEGRLVVVDQLLGTGRHAVCLSFQLGPSVCCVLDGTRACLGWDGSPTRAVLHLDPQLDWHAHRGEETPPSGWYSPEFGRRTPAVTVAGRGVIAERDELRCELVLR